MVKKVRGESVIPVAVMAVCDCTSLAGSEVGSDCRWGSDDTLRVEWS
jgi:hypothetical protein